MLEFEFPPRLDRVESILIQRFHTAAEVLDELQAWPALAQMLYEMLQHLAQVERLERASKASIETNKSLGESWEFWSTAIAEVFLNGDRSKLGNLISLFESETEAVDIIGNVASLLEARSAASGQN